MVEENMRVFSSKCIGIHNYLDIRVVLIYIYIFLNTFQSSEVLPGSLQTSKMESSGTRFDAFRCWLLLQSSPSDLAAPLSFIKYHSENWKSVILIMLTF